MNCNLVTVEMLDIIISKEAWDYISENNELNEEMLEKYADKLNWQIVAGNDSIQWTEKLLEKWVNRIDWECISRRGNESLFTPEVVEHFADRWNWSALSGNSNFKLDYDIIDKYIDRWDWHELINRYINDEDKLYTRDFFIRYREYIPLSDFLNESTFLWALRNKEVDRIEKEMAND